MWRVMSSHFGRVISAAGSHRGLRDVPGERTPNRATSPLRDKEMLGCDKSFGWLRHPGGKGLSCPIPWLYDSSSYDCPSRSAGLPGYLLSSVDQIPSPFSASTTTSTRTSVATATVL
jgi:hypothetical protein